MPGDHSGSEDEFWTSLDDAMDRPSPPGSPVTPAPPHRGHKRTAAQAHLQSDDEHDSPLSTTTPTPVTSRAPNQNLLIMARRISAQKKLRTEQVHEVEDFASATLSVQNIQLFTRMVAIENKLEKIVTSAPPFHVSRDSELYKNLVSYSNAVFFSSKLAAYKGLVPLNHVLDIVKRMRFGIPPGLERNTAHWNKVVAAVQNILTQLRGTIKKELKKSIKGDDRSKHWSIFDLTEKILKGTGCTITVPIMARVALMRKVYEKCSDDAHFWDAVDERLKQVLQKGKGAPEKLARAFKLILQQDRKDHGDDCDEPEVAEYATDDLQQGVDQGIERSVRLAATADDNEDEEAHEEEGTTPSSSRMTGGSATQSASSSATPSVA